MSVIDHSDLLQDTDCIEHDPVLLDCDGRVENRASLTGTGMVIPRCEEHWAKRLDREEELRSLYPDSSTPPSWFDPTYAGESWDEDY